MGPVRPSDRTGFAQAGAASLCNANGERDLDIPSSLRLAFGHKNLGVYLTVRERGLIAAGERLALSGEAEAPAQADAPGAARGRFICRGYYYIYDEVQGAPTLTPRFTRSRPTAAAPIAGRTRAPSGPIWRARPEGGRRLGWA